ncbi:MAG: alpha/beta fold hydrolase [Acidobacteriaceae bacterium]|nr:alpha/beta fold hydrolase [Acidobacteriaceae bacterium]
MDCKTQLNEDLRARIEPWLAADEALGVPQPHRRRLLVRGGGSETPLPTALSALMIHGLYDSPQAMADLAQVIADHSINTLVSRMRGHFEADRSVLERTVHWEEWLSDAGADFVLAQELGSKVVLLGHSTGALLVTWLAIRNPHQVAGLILFSPAFGVHPLALTGAWASQLTGINLATVDGKFRTGHSGLEVNRAIRAFGAWLRASSEDGRLYTHASKQLKDIPVWMANSAADLVIQKREARAFRAALKETHSPAALRQELWLPYSNAVLHDAITRRSNPALPLIKASLGNFLDQILDAPDHSVRRVAQ